MALTIGADTHRLDAASDPVAFAGDVPTAARLEGGPLLDFNVMVRRPLRAVVARRAFDPAAGSPAAQRHLVLLLEAVAGLAAFDLVDPRAAGPALPGALAGTRVLEVRILG